MSNNYHSDVFLLEEVKRVAHLVDKPVLTKADFKRHSIISVATVTSRFGNWILALQRAGLGHLYQTPATTRFPRNCPDEMLLDEVRRVAQLLGNRPPTLAEFARRSREATLTLIMRDGDWQVVLKHAGLAHMSASPMECRRPAGVACPYSDEAMLAEVRRIAEVVNKPVFKATDFSKHSKISLHALGNRFGKWGAVLERAGLNHLDAAGGFRGFEEHLRLVNGKFPDEALLEEVCAVWRSSWKLRCL